VPSAESEAEIVIPQRWIRLEELAAEVCDKVSRRLSNGPVDRGIPGRRRALGMLRTLLIRTPLWSGVVVGQACP